MDKELVIAKDFLSIDIDLITEGVPNFCEPISVAIKNKRGTNDYANEINCSIPIECTYPFPYGNIYKYVDTNTRWLPANPNKENTIRKLNDSYLPLDDSITHYTPNVANFHDKNGNINFSNAIDIHKYVILSGVRGIGKTAFLNYYFSNHNSQLELNRKTWFRIDASKVYDFFLIPSTSNMKVDELYLEYFKLHTLYVMFIYGTDLVTKLNIDGIIGTQSVLFKRIMDVVRAESNTEYATVYNILQLLFKSLKASDMKKDVSKLVIENMYTMLLSKHSTYSSKQKRSIYRCFKVICRVLEKTNISVIVIIDGVDNISWTKNHLFYQQTCSRFNDIMSGLKRNLGVGTQFVIATRPETVNEIRFSPTFELEGFNDTENEPAFETWKIVPPKASLIVKRKIEAIKTSEAFKSERGELISQLADQGPMFERVLDRLILYSQSHAKIIHSVMKNNFRLRDRYRKYEKLLFEGTHIYDQFSEENVLEFLYDNDVRAYIDNLVKVFFTSEVFGTHGHASKGTRERLLVQTMFLNGSTRFNSREHFRSVKGVVYKSRANYKNRGAVLPNIFWYPIEYAQGSPRLWHGLVGLRVLQCSVMLREFCLSDLIHILVLCFNYEKDVIIECIETFVACGLIDIEIPSEKGTRFFLEEDISEDIVKYKSFGRRTSKGRMFLEYVFLRPDILYYYALDAPMHSRFVEDDTKYVRFNRQYSNYDYIEDYFRSSIPTVGTFLMHVKFYAKKELSLLRSMRPNLRRVGEYFGDWNTFLSGLRLPVELDTSYLLFVANGISSRRKHVEIVEEIRLDILGVMGAAVEYNRQKK